MAEPQASGLQNKGNGGELGSPNFQAMKTQDGRGRSQGSFQGGLRAAVLLFAEGCPADELMSLPHMIQDAFGELGPQMLCSHTSLGNQLMIIVHLSLGLGEEGHSLPSVAHAVPLDLKCGWRRP